MLLDSLHYVKSTTYFTLLLVEPGPPSIENGAHDTEKLLLKTQVNEDLAS